MISDKALFITYWYPDKENPTKGVFIKKHADAISELCPLIILNIQIKQGTKLFQYSTIVSKESEQIETHTIQIKSFIYKAIYLFLPLQYFIVRKYVLKNITAHHPIKLIHGNVLFPAGIISYKLAKLLNKPYLLSEHWSKLTKFFKRGLYRSIAKKTLHQAVYITAVSEPLSKIISQFTNNSNIVVIPNVIDNSVFNIKKIYNANQVLTFIAAANWRYPKNPFYFLDALETIYKEKKLGSFKLILIGDGEQIKEIKKKNYQFNIEYKGLLNEANLAEELNKADVFLHGSDSETFSVIIIEALMSGLPSIVSPVGIAPTVIDSSNGFIAENNSADWANKIISCTSRSYNRLEISSKIGNTFSKERISKEFDILYKSVCNPIV